MDENMLGIAKRIKERRMSLGFSYQTLADRTGLSKSTLQRYETGGIKNVPLDKLQTLADGLNTTPNYLMGWEEDQYKPDGIHSRGELYNVINAIEEYKNSGEEKPDGFDAYHKRLKLIQEAIQDNDEKIFKSEPVIMMPVIGEISAGYDGAAIESYTGEDEHIPTSFMKGYSLKDFFLLRVRGHSMYPQFLEGDKVLVLRCSSVDSGTIAVIMYNGEDATLKKVIYEQGEEWLDLIAINPEYAPRRIKGADLAQCRVLGKVIKLIRDV